jgi:hypothetical protein
VLKSIPLIRRAEPEVAEHRLAELPGAEDVGVRVIGPTARAFDSAAREKVVEVRVRLPREVAGREEVGADPATDADRGRTLAYAGVDRTLKASLDLRPC